MANSYFLDTEFLIQFRRELNRKSYGKAHKFIESNANSRFFIDLVICAEFSEGFKESEKNTCWNYLSNFRILEDDEETAWITSRVAQVLKKKGLHIGDNDTWIGANAIKHKLPLVTNNERHFNRLKPFGLKIISY